MSIAYSVKGEKDKKLHITELTFNTDELLRYASEYGVTLTAFLSGVLTLALFDLQKQEKRTQKEIRLSIPIDLRRRFQRNSLRNFTLTTTIYAGKLKEETPFSTICQSFHTQLKKNVCKENLSATAGSYVKMAKNKILALLPLSLKTWAIRTFFALSQSANCMTFSNLGVWSLPDNLTPYIQQCSMAFTPKPSTPYSCGVVSVKNALTLTLTRSIKEPLLESRIIQILEKILSTNTTQLELIA